MRNSHLPAWASAAALASLPLQTPQRLRQLIDVGDPTETWARIVSGNDVVVHVPNEVQRAWACASPQSPYDMYEKCQRHSIDVTYRGEIEYPGALSGDPFAPAVLFEQQGEVFESSVYSPYMLVTTTVKEEWRNRVPAITHIDNSSRHQSVTLENNPRFHSLISKFYEKTGVPVLLNTSFNGPHEPIVETPLNAINTFLSNNLDILVIGNILITRD